MPEKPMAGGPAAARPFGDYDLLEEVARGGMGTVYRARQRNLGRIVAIKVLSSGEFASPEFVRRFLAESAAAARLQHPNIVAIHEVGEQDGLRYFSMDFVEGPNLAQLLADRPLPPVRAATCLRNVAEAIHYAHCQGILHRDLKPSNVLIDPLGEPRVTDFGLAREMTRDSDLTRTGQVLGTPGYLPPEQADSACGPPRPASDVYSLGAILYFMLTARAPFAAGTVHETLRQVLTLDPVAPSTLNPGVPRDLETICLKCLERRPARRYATAAALAEDLRRFLEGEPIVARPLSTPGRLARWCWRRPALAAVWLLVVVLTAGSTLSSLWIARARVKAEKALDTARAAEAAGREHLRDARLAQARAVRHTTFPGRRAQALAALAEAAQVRPGPDLRDEALATLLLTDIRVVTNWDLHPPQAGEIVFDGTAKTVAYEPRNSAGSERGPAELRRWGEDTVFGRIAAHGTNRAIGPLRFSTDGSMIMARYLDRSLRVWRTGEAEPFLVLTNRPPPGGRTLSEPLNYDYDFSPDGTMLALGSPGGGAALYRVADGVEQGRSTGGETFNVLGFSPDGRHLAAVRNLLDETLRPARHHAVVFRVPELAVEADFALAQAPGSFAWSGDSRLLAVSSVDRMVAVFDVARRRPMASLLCPGLGSGELNFVGEDRLIAVRGAATTLRLFNLVLGREELVLDGYGPSGLSASPGSRSFVVSSVACVATRWEVEPPVGLLMIPSPRLTAYENAFNGCCLDFSPDGRCLATSHGSHLLLRAVGSSMFSAERDFDESGGLNFATVAFTDGGHALLRSSSVSGLWRQNLLVEPGQAPRFGTAESLDPEPGFSMTDHSADGRRLALVNPEAGQVKVVEVVGNRVTVLRRWEIPDVYCVVMDPAGRTVLINRGGAETNAAAQHLELRSLSDGTVVETLGARPFGEAAWSADGTSVLTSNDMDESILWDTAGWRRRAVLRGSLGGNASTFALSPDGSQAVIARDERIHLVSALDGAERASFELPAASGLAAGIRFLPDGRRFAILWRDARVDVIDPDALRAGLENIGLTW